MIYDDLSTLFGGRITPGQSIFKRRAQQSPSPSHSSSSAFSPTHSPSPSSPTSSRSASSTKPNKKSRTVDSFSTEKISEGKKTVFKISAKKKKNDLMRNVLPSSPQKIMCPNCSFQNHWLNMITDIFPHAMGNASLGARRLSCRTRMVRKLCGLNLLNGGAHL